MTILVSTYRQDAMRGMLDALPAAARARGADLVLVDTDRFPREIDLDLRFEEGRPEGWLGIDGRRVDLGAVSAIWHRREHVGATLPADLSPSLRTACIHESRAVLLGALAATDAFHLDPQLNRRLARTKPLQLALARAVGLRTPRTITSNDPAALRAFRSSCESSGGAVIFKMLEGYVDATRPGRATVFTNRVGPEDLADDATLSLVPVTLQERIEKEVELRVTVVGYEVYAAAVRSKDSRLGRDDWRRDGVGLLDAWTPFALDPGVQARILALLDRLGLQYGALDLIVTPGGDTVFLEVNPVGEFFWLEQRLGFPVLANLVDLLVGHAPRRSQAPPPPARHAVPPPRREGAP